MSLPRTAFAALVCLVALASASFATIVLHADVTKLATLADTVVDATVESVVTRHEPQTGAIWTVATLRVRDTLSGTEHETLEVSVPGGSVGERTQEVSGTARLSEGKRVVVFLTTEEGRRLVLGQAQGCFHVLRDPKSSALVCRNDVAGLALVSADGDHVDAQPIRLTLDELRKRVRAAARARDEAERVRRESEERRLAELRESAERNAERMRGKPGGGE